MYLSIPHEYVWRLERENYQVPFEKFEYRARAVVSHAEWCLLYDRQYTHFLGLSGSCCLSKMCLQSTRLWWW